MELYVLSAALIAMVFWLMKIERGVLAVMFAGIAFFALFSAWQEELSKQKNEAAIIDALKSGSDVTLNCGNKVFKAERLFKDKSGNLFLVLGENAYPIRECSMLHPFPRATLSKED